MCASDASSKPVEVSAQSVVLTLEQYFAAVYLSSRRSLISESFSLPLFYRVSRSASARFRSRALLVSAAGSESNASSRPYVLRLLAVLVSVGTVSLRHSVVLTLDEQWAVVMCVRCHDLCARVGVRVIAWWRKFRLWIVWPWLLI